MYTATPKESSNGKPEYSIVRKKSVYFFINIFNLLFLDDSVPEGPLPGEYHGNFRVRFIACLDHLEVAL